MMHLPHQITSWWRKTNSIPLPTIYLHLPNTQLLCLLQSSCAFKIEVKCGHNSLHWIGGQLSGSHMLKFVHLLNSFCMNLSMHLINFKTEEAQRFINSSIHFFHACSHKVSILPTATLLHFNFSLSKHSQLIIYVCQYSPHSPIYASTHH